MFCSKCGSELPEGAAFCGSCGAAVSIPDSDAVPEPAASAAKPAEPASAATRSAPSGEVVVDGVALMPKKSKKGRVAIIAAVAAVVVVGAIGAYFALFAPYNIDEQTFPDSAVRKALADRADGDHDGKISRDEAAALTALDLSGSGVSALAGLDKFPNLATLNLANTRSLHNADFSQVKGVAELNLSDSSLEAADISMLAGLQSLKAAGASFANLDVSKNSQLAELSLSDEVDVSGLDATGLRAQYLMMRESAEGIAGVPDGQGGSSQFDDNYVEFTYDSDNILTGYTQHYASTTSNDSSSFGRRYTVEDGRIVASETTGTSYTTDGEIDYNDAGQPTEARTYSKSNSSSSNTVVGFEYNDAGKLAQKTYEYNSDTTYIYTYNYNDSGQLVGFVNAGDSFTSEASFTYDDQGRIVTAKMPWQEFEFEYNDAGQVSSKRYWFLDSDGKRSGGATVVTFTYDDQGRVASAKRENENNSSYAWELAASVEYDENGLVSSISRLSHSEYNGKTDDYEGIEKFEYHRVFTSADAADLAMPLSVGDPTTYSTNDYPLQVDVIGKGTQLPIVYQACSNTIGADVVL